MQMASIERLKSTFRWLGFTAWLSVDLVRWLPMPSLPPQQRKCLPLATARQAAEAAGPWLLLVLRERQQRGLGWEEAEKPLVAADLAVRPFVVSEVPTQPGWLLWRIESELGRLIRLVEAPERLLPTTVSCRWQAGEGMPYEARYRALAVGLIRACQLYAALEEMSEREEATEQLRAAAARVRQRATEAASAA